MTRDGQWERDRREAVVKVDEHVKRWAPPTDGLSPAGFKASQGRTAQQVEDQGLYGLMFFLVVLALCGGIAGFALVSYLTGG